MGLLPDAAPIADHFLIDIPLRGTSRLYEYEEIMAEIGR
jgi:hypothetical protein